MKKRKKNDLYVHDCSTCRYLGSGNARILAEHTFFDFYVCESKDDRSILARYGDRPDQYMSCPFLGCAELTRLDLVALYNGLELHPDENARLLQKLADSYRGKMGVRDYEQLAVSPEATFGRGNVLFPT